MNSTILSTTTTLISTTLAPTSSLPSWSGFLFLLGASFLYGSNYIPVKQYKTGDGMYFQLVLCSAIWTVGLVVYLARDAPTFYALPMLGGFLWATGNINSVVIIRTIGLGLGLLFWSLVGLITGWGTARYGWFGVKKQVPSNTLLNYIGVSLAILSTVCYLFVKSDARIQTTDESIQTEASILPVDNKSTSDEAISSSINSSPNRSNTNLITNEDQQQQQQNEHHDFLDRLNPNVKRAIGLGLSVFSGIMYGESNTPVLIARDKYEPPGHQGNYLDYLFSYYTGILAGAAGYFVIYVFAKKFKPDIYPQVTLAAFVSGWMWGGANLCYFMATNALSQSISYPISAAGPPIFANLWGVFLYKEIKGAKNFIFLLGGFALAIGGSVLVGLSF